MSSSAPKPIAEGHLSSAPLAHVLLSLHRRGMNGTLAVWPEGEERGPDRVLLSNGHVVAARLREAASTLERGLLPLFRRSDAPYAFFEGDLLGDRTHVVTGRLHPFAIVAAAIRGGAREDAIAEVLARHGDEKLRLVLGFDVAPFDLIPKERAFLDLLRAEPASARALAERSGDPKVARHVLYLLAITGGIETWIAVPASSASITDLLPGLDSLPPGVSDFPLASGFGSSVNARSSAPPSRADAASPSRPAAAPSRPAAAPSRPAAAPSDRPPAPSSVSTPDEPTRASKRPSIRVPAPPPPPPPVPEGLSTELTTRWRELSLEAVALDERNYFQMLGVAEAATASEVRDAYFAAVKRWHPDRLPRELEPLRATAEEAFRLLTEARDTLADDEKRARYAKAARDGGGTPASDRKLLSILTAAQEFDKATVLVNRGRFDEAVRALEVVLALDPEQADHYALLAWAKLHADGASVDLAAIVRTCDEALRRAPNHYNERALYTKGVVLKRLGKDDQAYPCFRAVADTNPRHVDAARETRLHQMRSRAGKADVEKPASEGDSKSSALFAKLWPGKKP